MKTMVHQLGGQNPPKKMIREKIWQISDTSVRYIAIERPWMDCMIFYEGFMAKSICLSEKKNIRILW